MKTVIAEVILGNNTDASIVKVIKAPRDVRELVSEGRMVAEMMSEEQRDDNYQVIELKGYETGAYIIEFNWDGENLTTVKVEKKEIEEKGIILVAAVSGEIIFLNVNEFFDADKDITEIFNGEECSTDIEDFTAGYYKVSKIDLDSEEEQLVAKFTKIKA